MTLLVERWPRLSAIPHLLLGTFPTPVRPLEQLSRVLGAEVWCKHDDRSGLAYGGNKVRKLEFLIGAARAEAKDTIVTTGAAGSHHVLATAIYGGRAGLEVHAIMMPQVRTPHVETNLRASLAAGATLHPIHSYAWMPPAMAAPAGKLKLEGRRVYLIGPGGSDGAGVLGYVEAGLEIAEQLARGELSEVDAVVVPLGSGGTAVGLAVGLAAAGVTAPVIAVRVTPRHLLGKPMLRTLAAAAVDRVRLHDERFPSVAEAAVDNLIIDEAQLGEGYGIATGAGREASRLALETDGLALDPSYSAKAMAAVVAGARGPWRGKRVLFVNTLNSVPLAVLTDGAPPLPKRLSAILIDP